MEDHGAEHALAQFAESFVQVVLHDAPAVVPGAGDHPAPPLGVAGGELERVPHEAGAAGVLEGDEHLVGVVAELVRVVGVLEPPVAQVDEVRLFGLERGVDIGVDPDELADARLGEGDRVGRIERQVLGDVGGDHRSRRPVEPLGHHLGRLDQAAAAAGAVALQEEGPRAAAVGDRERLALRADRGLDPDELEGVVEVVEEGARHLDVEAHRLLPHGLAVELQVAVFCFALLADQRLDQLLRGALVDLEDVADELDDAVEVVDADDDVPAVHDVSLLIVSRLVAQPNGRLNGVFPHGI